MKEVRYVRALPSAKGWVTLKENHRQIALDTRITETLRNEGILRELIRYIQGMRKDLGVKPKRAIEVYLQAPESLSLLFQKHLVFLRGEVGARSIRFDKAPGTAAVEKQCRLDGQELRVHVHVSSRS